MNFFAGENPVQLSSASQDQLQQWAQELEQQYAGIREQGLKLDLTRGKPSADQLDLANALDGDLGGDYRAPDGTDVRNYGGLDGLPDMKAFAAELFGVPAGEVLIGGNSSLTLMYQQIQFAWTFGVGKDGKAWKDEGTVRFLCPVPGYDRHFAVTEEFGIEMIPVPLTENGPDMDVVEKLIAEDKSIRGMWCVPKYSNPTGCIYSDETVDRIAALGKIAAPNFRVMWDNAYAVHDLDEALPLANIREACEKHGTLNSVVQFASTSKVTFAGAGVAFMAASQENLARFKQHLGIASIGPDKVNQLRHLRLLKDAGALRAHMKQHAELLRPRFDAVLEALDTAFGDSDIAEWTRPRGGYFVSFNSRPGLAGEIVRLAKEAGVVLTPAGATFPYGKDEQDRNIRIAPSFPSLDNIRAAMEVFVVCVKLASVRQALAS
ncbi:aminotransferase class I/II-fold pyridoxal phosphate-dependent enzyme [Granulosicoccaceae sp. 1_MG-2023]|nr:aminotransferase class I/II-fold pyridoxal phosphate-dependent enzyme [Granulosicoccaceae sp. 1_MG-2023]